MTPSPLQWCHNTSILHMHKIRLYCHIGLALMSVVLLLSTSIVLAYSIKMYRGSFLHAIPELMTASCASLVLIAMAWLPSNEVPGAYGLECMRYVWQEVAWSSALSLGLFGGLASLHVSTPGLMSSCGRFFICRGYIFIFIGSWFCLILISLPTILLLLAAIHQSLRGSAGQSVWMWDIERFEYFWPGQAHLKPTMRQSVMTLNLNDHHLAQPEIAQVHGAANLSGFIDEKRITHSDF